LDKLNDFLSKGGHAVVKGRLLPYNPLKQKATDFVDLSSDSDLILALLLPATTFDNLRGYPEICQIQVAENGEATPLMFHILDLGKGPALYSVDGSSHTYARVVTSVPKERQDRLAEALGLCGFIQAAVEGDHAKQAEYEEALRLSACLDKPK